MAEIFTGEIGLHRERQDYSAGFCFIKASPGSLSDGFALLHPSEKAYYDSLKHEARRASYLVGRIAAKLALGALSAGGGSGAGAVPGAGGGRGSGPGGGLGSGGVSGTGAGLGPGGVSGTGAGLGPGGVSGTGAGLGPGGVSGTGAGLGPGGVSGTGGGLGSGGVSGIGGGMDAARRIDPALIAIGFGVFQFPVVKHYPEGPVQVSISHCDDLGVALAYPEEHPLGVDLERADGANVEAIRSYISPAESALLARHGLDETPGLTILWTMKEGVSKVLRTGLTAELRLLEIGSLEIAPDGSSYAATFRHLGQYKALARCAGNHVCSVILPGKTTPDLEIFWRHFMAVAAR